MVGWVYDLSPWGPSIEGEDLAELVLGLRGFGEHPAGLGRQVQPGVLCFAAHQVGDL